jgi:hypothetical protein
MSAKFAAAGRGSTVSAFLFYVLAVASYSIVDIVTKLLRGDPTVVTHFVSGNFDFGTWQVMLLTRIPPLLVALIMTAQATGSPFRVKTPFFKTHLLRGFLVTVTTFTFFAGLKYCRCRIAS